MAALCQSRKSQNIRFQTWRLQRRIANNNVVKLARDVPPSARSELEIIELIRRHMEPGEVFVEKLGHGYPLLETRTHFSRA